MRSTRTPVRSLTVSSSDAISRVPQQAVVDGHEDGVRFVFRRIFCGHRQNRDRQRTMNARCFVVFCRSPHTVVNADGRSHISAAHANPATALGETRFSSSRFVYVVFSRAAVVSFNTLSGTSVVFLRAPAQLPKSPPEPASDESCCTCTLCWNHDRERVVKVQAPIAGVRLMNGTGLRPAVSTL